MTPTGQQQLVGKWQTDPADSEAIKAYGEASLDFSPDGRLVYTVLDEGKRRVMLLTYRIEGDVLITNQPSHPREERTRFEIKPRGKLVLLYERMPSAYVRVDDQSASPN